MWILIVIFLCASGSKAENICENNPSQISQMCSKYQPPRTPENVEEFMEYLRLYLKFMECLKNYEDSCTEIVLQEGEYDSIRSVITDISTEGTHLNSIVIGNFHCFKYAISNREINVQTWIDIETAYNEHQHVEEISEKDNKTNCLEWFDDMGNLVSTITTECGKAVEDAVIEVIHRLPFFKRPCSAQDVLELRNILEELNLDESNKAALRESFRLLGNKAEDICEINPYHMCSDKYLTEVPKNVEEFKVALRSMLKFYECLKYYEDSCKEIPQARKVLEEGEYDSIRSLIRDISTEGTHLNTIVIGNFHCLKYAMNQPKNARLRRDIENAFREHQYVEEKSEKYDSIRKQWEQNYIKKLHCLYWFDEMGSLVNTFTTECGKAVEDAVIELIHRAYFLKRPCSAQDVRELRNVFEEFNLDESNKAALRESFRLLGKSD
ncbi:hypothetical protein JTE90_021078 [Oedothorax gibbosus]|uniref:Uncharacterized protein n=1 Tax=Oedothorax gibbosus TaxID=931172 RepID=A0AAV6VTB7_9ARAC|nr:hypothetical protein JTE90_021078 [Oedothorax gibbosus]KAG8199068.1 hypothetical protein JTE90_021078 [Oedothorax gibbosus]